MATAAFAGAAGFYLNRVAQPAAPTDAATQALMRTVLFDLSGKPQRLEQWRGKVLVVNFWATWCLPCREEIPAFMRVEKKRGDKSVQIVGIALDDADKVRAFADKLKISYALLIGGADSLGVARDLGNRAGVLPFTIVMDRAGKVVHTHAGALTEAALDSLLAPLL